jgi:hypothetical protein
MNMDPYPHLDTVREELRGPYPSGQRSPEELGDTLARLVWEGFSDAMVDPEIRDLLDRIGVQVDGTDLGDRAAEELLILHLWAHSRAVELSFVGTAPSSMIRAVLDHLHRAVFEDMVTHGTPQAQIPVFEQRVSARYATYHAAARISDTRVGEVALEHLLRGSAAPDAAAARLLTERAITLAHPLRDYLEGVKLSEQDH